jgi:hypothetical protein
MYNFAFIFKCKQPNKIHHRLLVLVLDLDEKGIMILWNVENHSPKDSITAHKLRMPI